MFQFCKDKYLKHKELIKYLIFGILTTIVNFVIYIIFAKMLLVDEFISNVIAWAISVVFAYITNKIYVFESKTKKIKEIIKEIISFVGCRLFSGVVDTGSFFIFVTILKMNDILAKIIIAILVVILNYIFSKLIIFKNKKDNSIKEKEDNNK